MRTRDSRNTKCGSRERADNPPLQELIAAREHRRGLPSISVGVGCTLEKYVLAAHDQPLTPRSLRRFFVGN